MAAELQKTFFPRSYPVLPAGASAAESQVEFLHHYHASGLVSGDFCTISPLSDTEVGVFLCDVMGHGVRAALVTALICALVEETAAVERDPGHFLDRMNALLIPILRQEDMFLYATACYMVFDSATGLLKYSNAGHPIPLHFKAAENTAEWLMDDPSARGPALAISEDGGDPLGREARALGDTDAEGIVVARLAPAIRSLAVANPELAIDVLAAAHATSISSTLPSGKISAMCPSGSSRKSESTRRWRSYWKEPEKENRDKDH